MGCSRLLVNGTVRFALLLALLILLVGSLSGCGSQDVTIGEGTAELVFTNRGDTSVPVTVRWTGAKEKVATERFTVQVLGRVTLKLPPRFSYDIEMRPDCPSTSQVPAGESAPAQDEVIDARQR